MSPRSRFRYLVLALVCITSAPSLAATRSFSLRAAVNPRDPLSWQFSAVLPKPAWVTLTCDEIGGDHERHQAVAEKTTTPTITLHGLKAKTAYQCRAQSVSETSSLQSTIVRFKTDPLPAALATLLRISVPAADPARVGYTIFNTSEVNVIDSNGDQQLDNWGYINPYLVITDAMGNVRWYYQGIGGADIDVSYLGNDQILFGGDDGMVLMNGEWESLQVAPTIVSLDKKTLLPMSSMTPLVDSFNHDTGISEDGQSIFTLTYECTSNEAKPYYCGPRINQIDRATNTIVWTWSSTIDGASLYSQADSAYGADPYHGNAVDDHWENGVHYLYLSIKHLNQVIKIEHDSKKIIWRLGNGGDFTLYEADGKPADPSRWFSNQHDAKLQGNLFVIYDNGYAVNKDSDFLSRALTLMVDQYNKKAFIQSEYREANWAEKIWGGYDRLQDGSSLIAMGHCWILTPGSHNSSLVLLSLEDTDNDGNRDILWRADFINPKSTLYRAEHIDACDIFNNVSLCPAMAQ